MPNGGQTDPISTLGDNLLWKNAQKKLRKKENFRNNKQCHSSTES